MIIPVYNRAHTIRRAVSSVLHQSCRDFELLLVDDGSTDGSLAICREYETLDDRVRVFHTANRGVSAARNVGIQHARGKYIRFVDSDDELPRNSLAYLLEPVLEDSEIELVVACEDGDVPKYKRFTGRRMSQKDFLLQYLRNEFHNLYYSPCNKLYLRSVLEANGLAFDEAMHASEDVDFNFRYFGCIQNIYLSDRIVYRVHHPRGEPGHLSGRGTVRVEEEVRNGITLYDRMLELFASILPDYRKACAVLLMDRLWHSMNLIYRRSEYPDVERIVVGYDWRALLADCPLESCFLGYRMLYHCLVEKKARQLFLFFYCLNGLYSLIPYGARDVLRPLLDRCKLDYGRDLEG